MAARLSSSQPGGLHLEEFGVPLRVREQVVPVALGGGPMFRDVSVGGRPKLCDLAFGLGALLGDLVIGAGPQLRDFPLHRRP